MRHRPTCVSVVHSPRTTRLLSPSLPPWRSVVSLGALCAGAHPSLCSLKVLLLAWSCQTAYLPGVVCGCMHTPVTRKKLATDLQGLCRWLSWATHKTTMPLCRAAEKGAHVKQEARYPQHRHSLCTKHHLHFGFNFACSDRQRRGSVETVIADVTSD